MTNKFSKYYSELNLNQKEAVNEIEGPVMVIAGPGTGKTQIIAMRIANILQKTQVNPSNILCLTFTNSAVFAMRKRLIEIIGPSAHKIPIHTFHSFCNEIILENPDIFMFSKNLDQITEIEQIKIVQEILDRGTFLLLKPLKAPHYYQKEILKNISELKREGITSEIFKKIIDQKDCTQNDKLPKSKIINLQKNNEKVREFLSVFKEYEEALRKNGWYDFDDMILMVKNKLSNDPNLLLEYQEKYQYFLVDEFQDTNASQNEILKLLCNFYSEPNIFVVGDDEQSIFRFQGASLENILSFKNLYPKAKIIMLKTNYRSTQNIIDASRTLISKNEFQLEKILKVKKILKSNLKINGKIKLGQFSKGETEAYFIAKEIKDLLKKKIKASEIAIIYREHRDVEEIVKLFEALEIPYQHEEGSNILQDYQINFLIKLLKIVENPQDPKNNINIFEVLHAPIWKIPKIDLYKISKYASDGKLNIFDCALSGKILENAGVSSSKNFIKFSELILQLNSYFKQHSIADSFEKILNSSGFLKYILNSPDAVSILNKLETLFSEIKKINYRNKNLSLSDLLAYFDDLNSNNIILKEAKVVTDFDAVRIISAHKAKGLEFDYVFILKCIDNHWGNKKIIQMLKLPEEILKYSKNASEIEEERRLFYVALTRARFCVYITFASEYESLNNGLKTCSQFVSEIPEHSYTNIPAADYENNFSERLLIKFSPKKIKNITLKKYALKLLSEFKLSPTAYNTYLECPLSFFYNHLLRVPKTKDFNLCYGTAVHKALELFFKKYKKENKIPAATDLLNYFSRALNSEILLKKDYERGLWLGKKYLKNYYQFYVDDWKKGPPLDLEFSFYSHGVLFDKIPITGKIDKIELIDSIAKAVRITDYKTSGPKSLNQILGKTSTSDFKELNQAYFYLLLSESDPSFSYKASEIVFDFLTSKDEKFKKVTVPIDAKLYNQFKKEIVETYKKIMELEFPANKKACRKNNRVCEFADFCQKERDPLDDA